MSEVLKENTKDRGFTSSGVMTDPIMGEALLQGAEGE